jgi:hypothetical protein
MGRFDCSERTALTYRYPVSLIPRMICRPAIAMGGFVSAVNSNGSLSIARQNLIAGAVIHPCASHTTARSTPRETKRTDLSQWHNVLDDRTVIGMIVLRGRFEVGQVGDMVRGANA